MPNKYAELMQKYPFFQKLSSIDCGEGWYELIKNLCAELERLTLGPNFQVVQVKEKNGALRFYVQNVPDGKKKMVYKLIQEAENRSLLTCELCGKPGRLIIKKLLLKTRCPSC